MKIPKNVIIIALEVVQLILEAVNGKKTDKSTKK